jgi:hypothetical protein
VPVIVKQTIYRSNITGRFTSKKTWEAAKALDLKTAVRQTVKIKIYRSNVTGRFTSKKTKKQTRKAKKAKGRLPSPQRNKLPSPRKKKIETFEDFVRLYGEEIETEETEIQAGIGSHR